MTKKNKSVELRLTYRVLVKADEDITDEDLDNLAVLVYGEIEKTYSVGFKGLDNSEARLTCVEIDPDECREI